MAATLRRPATVKPGTFNCPQDDGSSILAGFVASATSYTVSSEAAMQASEQDAVSAQDAARYVTPNSVEEYAAAIVELVDDPEARARMGNLGRQRVEDKLAWPYQSVAYQSVFDELVGAASAGSAAAADDRRPSPARRPATTEA